MPQDGLTSTERGRFELTVVAARGRHQLPVAATCLYSLTIPAHKSRRRLKSRLIEALESMDACGFGRF